MDALVIVIWSVVAMAVAFLLYFKFEEHQDRIHKNG
jgi:hypothetical protein